MKKIHYLSTCSKHSLVYFMCLLQTIWWNGAIYNYGNLWVHFPKFPSCFSLSSWVISMMQPVCFTDRRKVLCNPVLRFDLTNSNSDLIWLRFHMRSLDGRWDWYILANLGILNNVMTDADTPIRTNMTTCLPCYCIQFYLPIHMCVFIGIYSAYLLSSSISLFWRPNLHIEGSFCSLLHFFFKFFCTLWEKLGGTHRLFQRLGLQKWRSRKPKSKFGVQNSKKDHQFLYDLLIKDKKLKKRGIKLQNLSSIWKLGP